MNQNLGGRCASGQTDPLHTIKPLVLKLRGIIDHVARHAALAGQLGEAVAVGAGGAANHDDEINLSGQDLDGILAVLGRVANVLLLGFAQLREFGFERGSDVCRVVNTERRLGHYREFLNLLGLHPSNIRDVFNEMNPL